MEGVGGCGGVKITGVSSAFPTADTSVLNTPLCSTGMNANKAKTTYRITFRHGYRNVLHCTPKRAVPEQVVWDDMVRLTSVSTIMLQQGTGRSGPSVANTLKLPSRQMS